MNYNFQMVHINIKIKKLLSENRFLLQGIIVLFFLGLTFILANIFENKFGNDYSKSKIQKNISKQELELNKSIKELMKEVLSNSKNFHFNSYDIEQRNASELDFYVYHGDSLVSWTDNEVAPQIDDIPQGNTAVVCKLDDGYYLVQSIVRDNYTVLGVYLLENEYSFENEFLQNKINPNFHIYKELSFVYTGPNQKYVIKNASNKFLFAITFNTENSLTANKALLLFIIYVLFVVFLLNFIYNLFRRKFRGRKLVLLFSMSVIAIRFLLQIIQFPEILYSSSIFQPTSFAISSLLPSLGDLFLSVYALLLIVLALNYKVNIKAISFIKSILITFSLILLAYVFYIGGLSLIEKLILNSNINFDISNLFSLNYLSIIGLSIITGILFINTLIIIRFSNVIKEIIIDSKSRFFVILVSLFSILLLSFVLEIESVSLTILYAVLVLLISYSARAKSHFKLANIIPLLLILSFISAISLNQNVHIAEQLRRQSIVRSVATTQDPQVEYEFNQVENKIYKDSILIKNLHDKSISFDSISNYITTTYFMEDVLWSKYDLQLTICDQEQELVIKPENIRILCKDFFYKNLITFGKLTSNKNLYHLKYGTGQINYLGLFRFYERVNEILISYTVYLEINSKLKRKGFTKLLSEKGNDPFEKLKAYSLAAYNKDTLVENYGSYSYPELLDKTMRNAKEMSFMDKNDFNHLIYHSSDDEYYVLSIRNPENLAKIAPFSYLFILYSLLFIAFSILFNKSLINWKLETNFAARLQLSMISIIIISFTIISYVSAHYIVSLNNEKNNQRLKDLSTSLQLEFEHKVRNVNVSETAKNQEYLQMLSIKFSKVFDTDINLYDLRGNLISATRPEIFEKHLLSAKINPMAFSKLAFENESFFVTEENIGKLKYSSAYLPFHNSQKEVVAYLNLPYFARQSELQNEISSFLMTLMNVYTFIIVLSIIVILLISNYISRPLRMIKEKLQKLTLGNSNEKIDWVGEDEIGYLVEEYNHMVDQMAIKADLLAKSERESAWREMAKQVAHEIKNPLTPMKLSVQYLLRSWNEKDPDWEDRLNRLSETLIQQIDTLSDIATAFSDFAKMPKSNNEKIELNETISHAIALYTDYENLQINFINNDKRFYIYADQKQLLRVFNNLIKNAIQAFEINQNGFIDIDVVESEYQYEIHFRDNGCGIPEDKKALIFVPNFTTKTKGTGLGLAMVKNIILSMNGGIDFESEEGKGTEFKIVLPMYNIENDL